MNIRVVGLAATLATLVLLVGAVVSNPIDEAHAQGTASVDYFLKIDGIEGESLDNSHPGEIQILSWSWGESNNTNIGSGGLSAGKVSISSFNFTMKVSKASPKLFLACATGQHIKSAILTARKSGGEQQTFLTWELKNVIISSFKTAGSPADPVPTDQIGINFSKIIITYTPQNADGSQGSPERAGYDVIANKKI